MKEKLQQESSELIADMPEITGLMIVGSGATLFEGDLRTHSASDLEVIPITFEDLSNDPFKRSAIAEKVAEKLASLLQKNGVSIKVESFYPPISTKKGDLNSQAKDIVAELATNNYHLIQQQGENKQNLLVDEESSLASHY